MHFTHKALRNVFFEVLRRGSQYGLMDVIRELCDAADTLAERANGGGNAAPGLNMALGAFEDKKHFCRYCKTRGHLIESCSQLERKKAREQSGLGGQQEGRKGRHHFEELGEDDGCDYDDDHHESGTRDCGGHAQSRPGPSAHYAGEDDDYRGASPRCPPLGKRKIGDT